MEFRRHSFREDRRRRVFTEETGYASASASPADAETELAGGREGPRSYSEAVHSPRQRRVIDLIPTRCWTLLVLTLLAVAASAGLLALHLHLALGNGPITLQHAPALDLTARGNVAQWLSSVLLLAAAGLGIVIYLIRRHRVDDYRGRYRMWYWMVPVLVLASLDQVVPLLATAETVLVVLTGIADPVRAQWGWNAALVLLAVAVTLRLAAEMVRSRLAVIVLTAAVACRVAAYLVQRDWLLHASGVFLVLYQVGAVLLSNILLLLSLGVYARYVYRDAHGEIVRRVREPRPARRARKTESKGPAARPTPTAKPAAAAKPAVTAPATMRIDPSHASAKMPAATPARGAQTAPSASAAEVEKRRPVPAAGPAAVRQPAAAAATAAAPEGDPDASLSRSERRRLRKLQRRGQPST